MRTEELKALRVILESGEYDDVHVVQVGIAIDELIKLIEFRDKAFDAHPNIDIDIEHLTV